ncbi:MAG: DNA-3-methyladenine glycosylase I [Chloroflexota bacterium]|nr:DNA-3-methyladenine glycosylase I [Chloroflexota bacterium]
MRQSREIPPKVTPEDDNGYFEELTKSIFRAGFSWGVVRAKWSGFRTAFHGFDLRRVAGYGPNDVSRLGDDALIVRNRRKILATIENARVILELVEEHGSFLGYLRSLDHLDYPSRVRLLTREFAGLGRTSAFVFLYCVNEETPAWQDR